LDTLPTLVDLFGNNEQVMVRCEKTGKAPKWADRLLRLLVQDYYGESVGVISLIAQVKALDHNRQDKRILKILMRTGK
jgi:putative transcriptional regulator